MLHCMVIGSGIAGLATALSLTKAGHTAVVYEAYGAASDGVGGFLTLAVNGFDALDTLGLKQGASELGFSTPTMSMHLGSTGRHLADFDYGGSLPDGTTARTLTRSELYGLLRTRGCEAGRPHRTRKAPRISGRTGRSQSPPCLRTALPQEATCWSGRTGCARLSAP